MPDRTARATAPALSDEAGGFAVLTRALRPRGRENVGHARLVAAALDERLLHTEDSDMAATIGLTIGGVAEELARARKLVADLQVRRAEIALGCAAMREALQQQ
jgi:hypothetical protein